MFFSQTVPLLHSSVLSIQGKENDFFLVDYGSFRNISDLFEDLSKIVLTKFEPLNLYGDRLFTFLYLSLINCPVRPGFKASALIPSF